MSDRKLRVFLCHASQDKPIVRELYQRLLSEHWIDPWLDATRLLPGQHWTSVIRETLDRADSVIIFISNNSIDKEGFVQREMNYAWERSLEKPRSTIYLIPIRLEECEVPYDLRERHWADYFGEKKEETYRALIESLKLRHLQIARAELRENEAGETGLRRIGKASQFNVDESPPVDIKEILRREHAVNAPRVVTTRKRNSIFSTNLAIVARPQTMGFLGAFLGLLFYFLPWNEFYSGFRLSFPTFRGYSPAFLIFPLINLSLILSSLYYSSARREFYRLAYILIDSSVIMLINFLAHIPFVIRSGIFDNSRFGLWGEVTSVLLILISGWQHLLRQNTVSIAQRRLLVRNIKRRGIIYFAVLLVWSLIITYADEIRFLLLS